jgi:hypothetical protein
MISQYSYFIAVWAPIAECAMLVGHYISPDKTIGKQFPQEKTIIENI